MQLLGLYVAGGIAGSLAHVVFFYIQAQSTGTVCSSYKPSGPNLDSAEASEERLYGPTAEPYPNASCSA